MAALDWNDTIELGYSEMDNTHREFVDAVNAYVAAADAQLASTLDALIAHCEPHFEQENRWAEEIGFPACHRNEHERVLAVLRAVRGQIDQGDLGLARRLGEELPHWFRHHAASMDAALAAMLKNGLTAADLEARNEKVSACGGTHACGSHHHHEEHEHAAGACGGNHAHDEGHACSGSGKCRSQEAAH